GISSVTQQSAAGTTQIARAAEDMNRLTVNLQNLVDRFKLSNNAYGTKTAEHDNAGRTIKYSKKPAPRALR
ncbi:MAG: hypothetical protein ACM3RX_10235, partial [Methanococcaceae archaeon]